MSKLNSKKNTVKEQALALAAARKEIKGIEVKSMARIVEVLRNATRPLTAAEILDKSGLSDTVSVDWVAGNLSAICRGNASADWLRYNTSVKFPTNMRSGDYILYPEFYADCKAIREAAPVNGSCDRVRHMAELDDMGNIIQKWDKVTRLSVSTYELSKK